MQPKLSLITACFNSEKSILRTVNSVLNQTYPHLEYIIIDGASRDQTLQLLAPYRDRISTLISEPDRGIYDALNKGIRLAQGEIIGFIHSDDELKNPHVVERMIQKMSERKADGIYSDLNYVVQSDGNSKVLRHWKSKTFTPDLLKKGWMPPHPTLYLKRSVYEKHGLFDLNYSIAADYDFILRVFLDPTLSFQYYPEVTLNMQTGGASNRNFSQLVKKSRQDFQILARHGLNPFRALFLKNITKIPQFFVRGPS